MARGWESKEIEAQMEAARSRRSCAPKPLQSAEEANRLRERESLELSRTRVLQDIESATHAGYRVMLERSLEFLNQKIAALSAGVSKPDPHE